MVSTSFWIFYFIIIHKISQKVFRLGPYPILNPTHSSSLSPSLKLEPNPILTHLRLKRRRNKILGREIRHLQCQYPDWRFCFVITHKICSIGLRFPHVSNILVAYSQAQNKNQTKLNSLIFILCLGRESNPHDVATERF